MKKVCHISSVHSRYDVRIFLKECRSLAKSGYEVTLLCADNKRNELRDGVNIKSVSFHPKNRMSRIFGVRRVILKGALNIEADIYHFHDPELLPVGLQLKKIGKNVIYDAHEDVPRQIHNKSWIPKFLRGFISWSFERYENYVVRKLDYAVTATPYIANRFQKICKKATAINNYPMLTEFDQPISWLKKQNDCCYIGGLTKIRGIRQIVEAAGLARIKLHLCGEFESKEFEEEILALSGFKYVKYYGVLDRRAVKKVLNTCKIGLVTFLPARNHTDAQPNKMFEYMAAEIPVIASNFPLWASIIEDNHCGVCVNPYDINAISNAIQYLVQNDNIAKKMGENGRRLVENKMNWEKQASNLVGLYEKLLM